MVYFHEFWWVLSYVIWLDSHIWYHFHIWLDFLTAEENIHPPPALLMILENPFLHYCDAESSLGQGNHNFRGNINRGYKKLLGLRKADHYLFCLFIPPFMCNRVDHIWWLLYTTNLYSWYDLSDDITFSYTEWGLDPEPMWGEFVLYHRDYFKWFQESRVEKNLQSCNETLIFLS